MDDKIIIRGDECMISINKWSAHDVRCLNAVMKVPEMAEVRVALYDDRDKVYRDSFLWDGLRRLGAHNLSGSYFSIDLYHNDIEFNMEFAGGDDIFVYKVTPKNTDSSIKFYVACLFRWGGEGGIVKKGDSIAFEIAEGRDVITVVGSTDHNTLVNTTHTGILMESASPFYIRCNNSMNVDEMESYIAQKHENCMNSLSKSSGFLKDSCEAIFKGLIWNTFYDPTLKGMCTSISRNWCRGDSVFTGVFGSYILAEWDTFFAGILSGAQDKNLAYMQVYNILSQATDRGLLPNCGSQRGDTEDRSQPPVGSYCVYKLYKQFNEKDLLENTFDKLMKWHGWWMQYRDGNGDGLLEWGSDLFPEGARLGFETHTMLAAKYESGLDNSPMYDDVEFNKETNTMELADVGLNSLYAVDAWALARIARELGREEAAKELEAEYEKLKKTINDAFWSEEKGIYLNRHWNGKLSNRISPTNFYPMIAGIASKEQAERMVNEHLLNPEEFWGEYVIPSISRDDTGFHDNNYWRGRVWGPMNFLVAEGLKRYDFYDVSYEFAKKSLNLFMKEWKEKSHIHENYNSVTGDSDDVPNSDPVYHWGALLAYLAISELIEVQPWEGIRFGNLTGDPATVENFPIGDDRYTVVIDEGLTVSKNGQVIVKASKPVLITDYKQEAVTASFMARCGEGAEIEMYFPEGTVKVLANINGEVMDKTKSASGGQMTWKI